MSADLLDHTRRAWCGLCEAEHEPCLRDELVPLPYCNYCGTFGHEATDCDERPVESHRYDRDENVKYPELHDRELLAYWIEAGLTYPQMTTRIGCSRPALTNAIARHGLVRRPRRDLVHPVLSNRDWLAEHCDGSLTLEGIAAAAGSSLPSVRKWIDRHDLHDLFVTNRLAWAEADKVRRAAEREANKPGPKFPGLRDLDWLTAAVNERGAAAVSRELGCHISSVMRALDRHGISYPKFVGQGEREPHPDREAAVALYVEGYTCEQVADVVGVSISAIGDWVQDAGVSRRKGRPRKPGRDNAIELYAAGATLSEAGAAVGVTGATVRNWLIEEGLPVYHSARRGRKS